MPRIGLIGGTVFFGVNWFGSTERKVAQTEFGEALLFVADDLIFLPRHGTDEKTYVMPHRINHAANFTALRDLGVERVIGVNSCGSVNESLKPGMIAIPDDFISFFNIPSIYQESPGHIAPVLDPAIREELFKAAAAANIEVHEGGVYWQNSGPRLETKAEIRMIRQFADIVGMTMGSEAALACEVGVKYGSLCSIDNYAHGLTAEPLTEQQIRQAAARNAEKLVAIVEFYLKLFT